MNTKALFKNGIKIIEQTSSYNNLAQSTKPLINSVVLEGNRTAQELNLMTQDEIRQLIAQSRDVKRSNDYPLTPQENVIYYVGTTTPYNVCMYAKDENDNLVRIDMGTTNVDIDSKQDITDNNLGTTSKNIVGAINEVFTEVNKKQNTLDDNLLTTNKSIVPAINEIVTDYSKKPEDITDQLTLTFYENHFSILDNNIKCIKITEGVYYIFMTFVNDSSYVVPLNTEIRILTDMKINGVRPRACVLNAISVTDTSIIGCTYNGVGTLYANLTRGSGIIRIRVSGVLTTI